MNILGFDVPLWLLLILLLLFIYYRYMTKYYDTFKKLGIPGPTPCVVFGNLLPLFRKGVLEADRELIKEYGKVCGTYQGQFPMLFVADLDMLKQILIKEFTSFTNHFNPYDVNDPPLDNMITIVKDDHWRHIRNLISPTFSSGKLRKMKPQLNRCAGLLVQNLEKEVEKNGHFDVKQIMGNFTMDVIASTGFNLDIDSQNDPNNKFVALAKKASDFSLKDPKMIILFFFPFLLKPLSKLGIKWFPKDVSEFFADCTKKAMTQTSVADKGRIDFLQLMVNALHDSEQAEEDQERDADAQEPKPQQSVPRKGLTEDEVMSQSLIFFIAGYETVANTMTNAAYLLALNPEAQQTLREEINSTMDEANKSEPDYEIVNSMSYLEMVLLESMRMYPAAPRTDRCCNKTTNINGTVIPEGMGIAVPIDLLHHDPDIWPEPDTFKPERFSTEERANHHPCSFMPFGVGPRSCVAMRLALLEIKVALVHILRHHSLVPCDKTKIPIQRNNLTGQPSDVFLTLRKEETQ